MGSSQWGARQGLEKLDCWTHLEVSDSGGKVWIASDKFPRIDGLGKLRGR